MHIGSSPVFFFMDIGRMTVWRQIDWFIICFRKGGEAVSVFAGPTYFTTGGPNL